MEITTANLERALAISKQIENLKNELQMVLGGANVEVVTGKREMSAKARAKIAAAQEKRWALWHEKKAQEAAASAPAPAAPVAATTEPTAVAA